MVVLLTYSWGSCTFSAQVTIRVGVMVRSSVVVYTVYIDFNKI